MARYNINLFGKADDFFKKLPKRKKTVALNAIINFALTNRNIKDVLRNHFTEEQVDKIFDKKEEGEKHES